MVKKKIDISASVQNTTIQLFLTKSQKIKPCLVLIMDWWWMEFSPIQFLTSGGGSKAWRGDVNWWNPKEMKFFYDGQGFMSMKITQTQVDIAFFDVFGRVLHKWATSKPLYSTMQSRL